MLDVSLNLAVVAATLFGIALPGHQIKVDGPNNPTAKPIPDGRYKMGTHWVNFKAKGEFFERPHLGTREHAPRFVSA